MTVVFTKHAIERLRQRAHMNASRGKEYVRQAVNGNEIPAILEHYRLKNPDPSTEVVAHKHLMFVIKVDQVKGKITVITVLIAHWKVGFYFFSWTAILFNIIYFFIP